jgi:hypothetical protein
MADSTIVWQQELQSFLDEINDGTGPDLKPMLVHRFAGKPCILLNNHRLRVMSEPSRRAAPLFGGRPRHGHLQAQLLAMKREIAKYSEHPRELTLQQVIERTGWTRERVAHYRRRCKYLPGRRGIRHRAALRLTNDGRLRSLRVHDAGDVETIIAAIDNRNATLAKPGPGWMELKKAAQRHHVERAYLQRWIHTGAPQMGGAKLDHVDHESVGRGRDKRVFVRPDQVAEFVRKFRALYRDDVPPIAPDGRTWWPTKSAAKIAGRSVSYLEHMLHNRKLPYIKFPAGIKLERRIGPNPRGRRRQGYWLEGPLFQLRDVLNGVAATHPTRPRGQHGGRRARAGRKPSSDWTRIERLYEEYKTVCQHTRTTIAEFARDRGLHGDELQAEFGRLKWRRRDLRRARGLKGKS